MTGTTGSEGQTYTRDLAAFAHDMRLADVPAEARHEALRILIDCLGCGVAGLVAPGTRIAIDLAREERGPLQANVISSGLASVLPACYANTSAINSLDFDVYGPEAHLAPVVVSAALAMGDAVDASGADVFAAMCAGLEGEEIGFWRFAGAPGCDWSALTGELGHHWVLPEVSYKLYPAGLYNSSAISEVQRLVREHELAPDEIERVEVRSTRTGSGATRPPPTHYLSAWGNAAYSIAAGVFDVRPLRSWEEPHIFQRPDILAFMQKVQFKPLRDGEVTSTGNYWERWAPVRVTIEARGEMVEGGRDHHLAMDDAGLVAKFHDNAGGLLSNDAAHRLERACWDLEGLTRVRDLTMILAGADASKVG